MVDREVHDVATWRLDGTRCWCSKMGGGISGVLHGGVVLGPRIDARGLPADSLRCPYRPAPFEQAVALRERLDELEGE